MNDSFEVNLRSLRNFDLTIVNLPYVPGCLWQTTQVQYSYVQLAGRADGFPEIFGAVDLHLHQRYVPDYLYQMIVPVVQFHTANGVSLRAVELNSNKQLATFQLSCYVSLLLRLQIRLRIRFRAQIKYIAPILPRANEHGNINDRSHCSPGRVGHFHRHVSVCYIFVSEGGCCHVVLTGVAEVRSLAFAREITPPVCAVATVFTTIWRTLGLAWTPWLDVLHVHGFRRGARVYLER